MQEETTHQEKLLPDIDESEAFLKFLFKSLFEILGDKFTIDIPLIRPVPNSTSEIKEVHCQYSTIRKELEKYSICNLDNFWDWYYGANSRPGPKRGEAKYIQNLTCLYVDLDTKLPRRPNAYYDNIEDALEAVDKFPIPPSVIINSGNGLQPLWLLDKTVKCQGEEDGPGLQAKQILRGLNTALNGDSASSIQKLLRLPGTVNHNRGQNPKTISRCLTDLNEEIKKYKLEDLDEYRQQSSRSTSNNPINDDIDLEYEGEDVSNRIAGKSGRPLKMAIETLEIYAEKKELIISGSIDGFASRSDRDYAIVGSLIKNYGRRKLPYSWETLKAIFTNPNLGCHDRTEGKGDLKDIERLTLKFLANREATEEAQAVRAALPQITHVQTEDDLPIDNDFLKLYVEEIAKVSDSPKIFSLFSGLALLSGILNKHYFYYPGKTQLNLYILLLAPSSLYRKTTSVNFAHDLLHMVNSGLIFPSSFTPEAFFKILQRQNRGTIFWPELIEVKEAFGKDYNKGLSSFLTAIYDFTPIWKRETKKDGQIEIIEPVISILCAGITTWLLDKLDQKDFQGGLWTRFLFVPCAETSRPYNFPQAFEGFSQPLVEKLNVLDAMPPQKIDLSEIRDQHIEWATKHQQETLELASILLQANFQRLEVMLLKIAALFQLAQDQSFTITPPIYVEAIKTVEFLKKKLIKLFREDIAFSEEEKDKKQILKWLRRKGENTKSPIMKNLHINALRVGKALEEMIDEGLIEARNFDTPGRPGRAYKAVEEGDES